jgi:molybdate transport system substrate-binding protein
VSLRRPLVATLALLLLFAACSQSTASPSEPASSELLVFAAASLRDVADELTSALAQDDPGIRITWAFDGSNVLATQIAEGAPADVFLSADTERPDRLVEEGLTTGAVAVFARNSVALVVPLEDAVVESDADLGQPGVKIVGAGPGVPITRYADALLEQLGAVPGRESAFAENVRDNIVSREDNVRSALAKVELDEGDAAFVYATDVLSSDDVREIPLPSGVGVLADYAAVQVSDEPAARELVEWLMSAEASEVLVLAGFEAVGS